MLTITNFAITLNLLTKLLSLQIRGIPGAFRILRKIQGENETCISVQDENFKKSYMIKDTTEVINIKSLKVTEKIRYRIQENFTVLNYNRISSCLVLALQGNQLDNLIH